MPVGDAAWEKNLMERVEEIDQAFREGLQKQFAGIPSGFETVSDEEWCAEFERKEFEAGWGNVTDPATGQSVYVNYFTFALALDTVDGGAAILSRYARIRGKAAAV